MPWNKLYKTTYIKENKLYFQERLPIEDELWTPLIACTAKSMYAVQKKTYHYELREGSLMTSKEREPYFQTLIRILQCFYNHAEQQSPVLDSEAMMLVEKRWIREIIKYAPVKVCYAYKYSYATIGSVCQKTIYGLKLMKHKLHTVFS